jgi:hypothetical protein
MPLGRIDGSGDSKSLGESNGVEDGVGAGLHSVPGRKSSFSELLVDADGDGEADGEGLAVLAGHGGPSTSPSGRLNVSTVKCAWVRPLLMKSLSTELPTMLP